MTRSILPLTAAVLLTGCNMAPTYVRPAPPVAKIVARAQKASTFCPDRLNA